MPLDQGTSLIFNDLEKARASMWKQQEKLNCFPDCDIVIYRNEDKNSLCTFAMNDPAVTAYRPAREPYLCCYLSTATLVDILNRKVSWNAAEIGCLIEFDRKGPYLPDVHTLLEFFKLPKGNA